MADDNQNQEGPWSGEEYSDEDRGFIENKGWKGPSDMFQSYKHLEQLHGTGSERLVKLPADWDNEEEVKEYRSKIGVPESPDQYELPEVEVPEGQLNMIDIVRRIGHKHGFSQRQILGFLGDVTSEIDQFAESRDKSVAETSESEKKELEREWGQEFDANIQAGARGARHFGIDEDDMKAMESAVGTKKFLTFMAKIGRSISEDDFTDEDLPRPGGQLGMTPDAAAAAIRDLEGDPEWQKAFSSENEEVRKAALAKRARLYDIAYPE